MDNNLEQNEVTELTTRERMLLARGDVALTAMQGLLHSLAPAVETNMTLLTHLERVVAQHPQENTLLDIVTKVTRKNVDTLRTMHEQVESVMREVDAFCEGSGVEVLTADAVGNVLNAIRGSSEFYATKTDEELKGLLGL